MSDCKPIHAYLGVNSLEPNGASLEPYFMLDHSEAIPITVNGTYSQESGTRIAASGTHKIVLQVAFLPKVSKMMNNWIPP